MLNHQNTSLCPAQKRAFEALWAGLSVGTIFRLTGGVGRGKTTVLKELHRRRGGAFLNVQDFIEASAKNNPWPWKKRFTN